MAGLIVLAPTDMTHDFTVDTPSSPGYQIFSVATTDTSTLCLSLGHLALSFNPQQYPNVRQGANLGTLVPYPGSVPHYHIGLWTVPKGTRCATSNFNLRTPIPFDGTFGGTSLTLDGVSYPRTGGTTSPCGSPGSGNYNGLYCGLSLTSHNVAIANGTSPPPAAAPPHR